MADKAITELVAAEQITATDLFVLQQNNTAKKLPGQVLLNWLTAAADGHGGIRSIAKASTSGLVDTYRITLADTTTFDFLVSNGKGINSITKTGTEGLVDTYAIQFNDNTSTTFTVTNGAKGDKGDNTYTWIRYASQMPTESSHSFGEVPDDWIGIYFGASDTAPTDWKQYSWFKIKGEKGDTGEPATLVSNTVEYQVSDSGTIIPSGAWGTSIPVVAQGKYLWTRVTTTFNSGSSAVSYSVSRMGIDGTGSVSSVAGISPNPDGNVPLTAEDVGALPKTGGSMAGALNMNGQKLSGLNAPTADDEAATKGFVANEISKIDVSSQIAGKVDKSSVVNNTTTTEEGYVADARTVKTLKDLIDKKPGLSMDTLWQNGSVASKFAAQKITLNLSPYILFYIEYAFSINSDKTSTFLGRVNTSVTYAMIVSSSSNNKNGSRAFTVSSTGLDFATASYDGDNNNDYVIPNKIFGIRGSLT